MNRTRLGWIAAAVLGVCSPASAQLTLTWNSTTSDWGTSIAWTPNTVPTAADTARFVPTGAGPLVSVVNPNIAGPQFALSLTVAPNQQFGGWSFGGAGSLTIGGTGSTGLTTYGPATQTFDGPTLAGSTAANTIGLNVRGGSTLALQGASRITANQGITSLFGGTLRLDNSVTNDATRVQAASSIVMQSGTFDLIGGAAATTYDVGQLSNAGGSYAGLNVIRATPTGGAVPTLRFANPGAFSTRLSTFNVLQFEAGSGILGADARITFVGTPGTGANGLLANTTSNPGTSGTFGYATVKDANGVDFATWNATNGVVAAGATQTASTRAAITGTDNTSRVFYIPAAGTDTSGTALTVGSIRITPQAAGATLAMGTNNLVSNALMLDGPNDFAITGTGQFGATGTRYIYVNSPDTTLSTGLSVVNGTNPSTFAGPGVLDLNGAAVQAIGNTSANSSNRFDIMAGVVRGTEATIGFTVNVASPTTGGGSDAFAALNFRGGVLEIQGGANGTGAAADFRRVIGTVDGTVRWEGGGGGFSAFASNASVNIGGASAAVQWNATNFVGDGFALRFGSRRSNAVLTFENPLQLDNGTAYQLREVNVTDNPATPADRTVLSGAITGAPDADFIKTGTGILVLTGTNTFAGATLVREGTLVAANATTSTGTGRVIVGGLGTLSGNGTIDPTGTNAVTVLPGGVLAPANTDGTPAALTVDGPVTLTSGSTFRSSASSPTVFGQLVQNNASGAVNLNGATLQFIGLAGFNPISTDRLVVISNAGGLTGTFNGLADNASGTSFDGGYNFQITYDGLANGTSLDGGSSVILYNFTPVPEPTSLLGVAAVGLGLVRLVRRRK